MPATDLNDCLRLLRFAEAQRVRVEAIAKATGDNFNIFNILGIGHYEVTTHSPMLGELLNPEGRHGQGAMFLHLFLLQFKVSNFDADSAELKREFPIGPKAGASGGRIDILLKDRNGSAIIIENKIYTGDGYGQLELYRKAFPEAELFYLTLAGDKPKKVCGGVDPPPRCISYKTDILGWLRDCHKAAVRVPAVRETIYQYIRLIEELTDQGNMNMDEDLVNGIVDGKESLAAFFALHREYHAVCAKLMGLVRVGLEKLATDHGLEVEVGMDGAKYGGFYFRKPELENYNLRIGFEFDKGDFKEFFYGLAKIDFKKPYPVGKEMILAKFKETLGSASDSENWPAYAYWDEPYRYWRAEVWEDIRSGNFAGRIEEKLIRLISVAEKACSAKPPTAES